MHAYLLQENGFILKNNYDTWRFSLYIGIDESMRKKMNGIVWAGEWSYKVMEFKYNKKDDSGARYGMVAFGKDDSRKFVDCMYVLYKMDFKIAPQVIVTEKKHSILWGLFSYTSQEREVVQRDLGVNSIKVLQNFFRAKALQGFYKEGLIDQINWVANLDEAESTENAIKEH